MTRTDARGPARIGVDVGGTNTDAVLLEDDRVTRAVKTPTTADVTTGVSRVLDLLLAGAGAARGVDAVMIGTTHFTNAVIQRRQLTPVAGLLPRPGARSWNRGDRARAAPGGG